MTERLYYRDPFLREFTARAVRASRAANNRVHVLLDRTAFYPTSGGQPHDLGTLDAIPVLEVFEDSENEIVHVLEREPSAETIQGTIDWPRRFDHMQQHTGQHVLSAAFVRLFNFSTVSFHLGQDICTIDLETPSLARRQLEAAEELANQVIFEDRPVHIRFAEAGSIPEEELRRAAKRTGELRIIDIEDFDRCPCGGTHVARTGQIGVLLARSAEKTKGWVRVEFICGGRSLRAARADHDNLSEVARLLTTGKAEVADIIRKSAEERRQAEKERERLRHRLAEHEAQTLLAQAEPVQGRRLLVRVLEEADAGYLRLLAARLVKEASVQVLLATRSAAVALVFAQTPGLPADMNALLRQSLQKHGGKGGGSRDFAQGSVPAGASPEDLLAEAAQFLRS